MKQPVYNLAQSDVSQRLRDGATLRSESATDCQHSADTKAFKAFTGRGREGQADFCKLEAKLERLHAEMDELAQLSKTVRGRGFYLSVHRRAANGQHSLRWRNVVGNAHLPWEAMPALFAQQLKPIAAWYIALQARIEALNNEECVVRRALHQAKKAVSSRKQ